MVREMETGVGEYFLIVLSNRRRSVREDGHSD